MGDVLNNVYTWLALKKLGIRIGSEMPALRLPTSESQIKTMKTAKLILEQFLEAKEKRVYTRHRFSSRSDLNAEYVVKVFYGGTLDRPIMECECPRFKFKKWCRHCDMTWNEEMTPFARMATVHHDEIVNKLSRKK